MGGFGYRSDLAEFSLSARRLPRPPRMTGRRPIRPLIFPSDLSLRKWQQRRLAKTVSKNKRTKRRKTKMMRLGKGSGFCYTGGYAAKNRSAGGVGRGRTEATTKRINPI
ncbi:hypothetical protein NE237_011896 [Protea cynaroides]|uniref:Uncharacterized protein n=1 Tax=Protea cynaroides TaxID=273540 RepID=A0A9Q0JYS0_9MAGN|nr:hypothetical protein NE237_011896 [Protea cynaroides]